MFWLPFLLKATAAVGCYPWCSGLIYLRGLQLKNSLTVLIPSPIETSLQQSDLARCKAGLRYSPNLTLAAIFDFTQALLCALDVRFEGWFGPGMDLFYISNKVRNVPCSFRLVFIDKHQGWLPNLISQWWLF